jgi:hypothetical protein
VDVEDLIPGTMPPPNDATNAPDPPKRIGPPPLPALMPPSKNPDPHKLSPVLDFSGLKDDEESPSSVRGRSESGVASVTGSSLSTQTHLAIDERLQAVKIVLPNVHEIDLAVLRDLSAMLLYARWIMDEQKLRPAMVAFLSRVRNEKEANLLKKETRTLEGMFIREFGKIDLTAAKKLSADKERRKTPPASNG